MAVVCEYLNIYSPIYSLLTISSYEFHCEYPEVLGAGLLSFPIGLLVQQGHLIDSGKPVKQAVNRRCFLDACMLSMTDE
jgi:hypothetical protein